MSGKTLVLVIALATSTLALVVADIRRDPAAGAGSTAGAAVDSYTVTVDVESLQVVSYLDDDGTEHPADSTLVPPVPERGPRRFTVAVDRAPETSAPVAGRIEPR